jgi:hypothetical protein
MLYEPGPSTTRSTPVLVGMIVAAALPVVVGSTVGVDTMVVATAADGPSLGALPPQAANVATPNTMNNNGIIRPPTRYASATGARPAGNYLPTATMGISGAALHRCTWRTARAEG